MPQSRIAPLIGGIIYLRGSRSAWTLLEGSDVEQLNNCSEKSIQRARLCGVMKAHHFLPALLLALQADQYSEADRDHLVHQDIRGVPTAPEAGELQHQSGDGEVGRHDTTIEKPEEEEEAPRRGGMATAESTPRSKRLHEEQSRK